MEQEGHCWEYWKGSWEISGDCLPQAKLHTWRLKLHSMLKPVPSDKFWYFMSKAGQLGVTTGAAEVK